MNYIKVIEELPLYTEGESKGYIRLWDFSQANSCEAARVAAVTTIVSVCRGKQTLNPEKLYKQLMTEHNGKPGSAFEFIPVKEYWDYTSIAQDQHGYEHRGNVLTNARITLESGKHLRDQTDNKTFIVFEAKFPYTFGPHLLHHRKFTPMCASERHQQLREYYYCSELQEVWENNRKNYESWNELCYNMSQYDWDKDQSDYNIRKELTNKGSHGLMFVTYWMCGWLEDPRRFGNLIKIRYKNPAMKEIQILTRALLHLLVKNNLVTIDTLKKWDSFYPKAINLSERFDMIKSGSDLL